MGQQISMEDAFPTFQKRCTELFEANLLLQAQVDVQERQISALAEENERLKQDTVELLKLRGEVAALRQAAKTSQAELASWRKGDTEPVPPGASKLLIHNPYLARETWSDKGSDTPYHAFETMLWAGITGNAQRLAEVQIPGDHSTLLTDRPPLMKIKGVQIVSVDGGSDGLTRIGAIVEDEFYGGGLSSRPGTVQNVRSWDLIRTNDEWKVSGGKYSW